MGVSWEARKKRERRKFIITKFTNTLDKFKSDRDAFHILIATTEAVGHDVDDFSYHLVIYSYFYGKNTKKRATKIKKHFKDG